MIIVKVTTQLDIGRVAWNKHLMQTIDHNQRQRSHKNMFLTVVIYSRHMKWLTILILMGHSPSHRVSEFRWLKMWKSLFLGFGQLVDTTVVINSVIGWKRVIPVFKKQSETES